MRGHARKIAAGFAFVLGLGLASCGRDSGAELHSTTPTTPMTPTQSSVTLTGVVYDHTPAGPHPRANVSLLVRASGSPFVYVQVISDALGRYSIAGVPSGSISIAPAPGSGYAAPCPAGWDVVKTDRTFDIHVVSANLLSSAGAPVDLPTGGSIWVSGVVRETAAQGSRPIAGAVVNLDGDAADPRAGSTTLTDDAGRYLLCPALPSTGTDQYAPVSVSRDGFRPAIRTAFLGWDYSRFDFELVRY